MTTEATNGNGHATTGNGQTCPCTSVTTPTTQEQSHHLPTPRLIPVSTATAEAQRRIDARVLAIVEEGRKRLEARRDAERRDREEQERRRLVAEEQRWAPLQRQVEHVICQPALLQYIDFRRSEFNASTTRHMVSITLPGAGCVWLLFTLADGVWQDVAWSRRQEMEDARIYRVAPRGWDVLQVCDDHSELEVSLARAVEVQADEDRKAAEEQRKAAEEREAARSAKTLMVPPTKAEQLVDALAAFNRECYEQYLRE